MTQVERVKQICKERKISMHKLEMDCGFSNGYISQLKKGVFPADRAIVIAKYLGISLEDITGQDENDKIDEIWIDPIEYDYRALPPGAAQIRKVLYEKAMGKAVGETAAEKLKLSLAKKMMDLESIKEEKQKAETEQLVEYFNQLPDSLREVFLNFVKSTAEEYANKT